MPARWLVALTLSLGVLWMAESLAEALEEDLSLEDALGGFDSEVAEESGQGETTPELGLESEMEGVLEGFDEEGFDEELPAEAVTTTEESMEEGSGLSWKGHWINALSWNFDHSAPATGAADYRGLSKLSTKLWLELEQELGEGWTLHGDGYLRHDFAYDLNSEPYTQAVLDSYRSDEEIGELWLRGSLHPDLDLKLGRQIVVWGQSDYLRVNDTINPIDLREPGLGDIETLRRPVGMVRADYYRGDWRLTALAIAENRPNLGAPCGSDFSQLGNVAQATCDANALGVDFPSDGLEKMEVGLSAMGRFSGWDLSLYGARLNHDTPYKESGVMHYPRVTQLGAALNIADGSWLWKSEAAWLDGINFANGPAQSRLDLLLGGEYRGISNTTLSFEVVRRHLNDYTTAMATSPDNLDENSWTTALAWLQDFRNETIHLKGVVIRNGSALDEGGSARLSLQYDLDDAWSVTGGGIWYDAAKYPPDWSSNDRLFLEARRDF